MKAFGVAKTTSAGVITKLDRAPQQEQQITKSDVEDSSTLARQLQSAMRDISELKRRWWPRRMDFEDLTAGSVGAPLRLTHNFGGRVRWWVVDWVPVGSVSWTLKKDTANTTANTLVLLSYFSGTVSIRVEEAG